MPSDTSLSSQALTIRRRAATMRDGFFPEKLWVSPKAGLHTTIEGSHLLRHPPGIRLILTHQAVVAPISHLVQGGIPHLVEREVVVHQRPSGRSMNELP